MIDTIIINVRFRSREKQMFGQFLYKTAAILFLFLSFLTGFSQDTIKVNSAIDRNSILIGERISLVYEAEIPETLPIRFFLIDTIEHFEFIDKGRIDTINTSSGTLLRQRLTITSFDSGQWVIPSFQLGNSGIQSDSFLVDVRFTPFDTAQGYNDIRDIIEIDPAEEKESNLYWIAAIATVIVLVAIFFLARKKKPATTLLVKANPYEEAMKKLDQLGRQTLPPKEFHTALTDIFREYLAKRKNISSLQRTTDELVVQLHGLNMNKETYSEMAQALRLSDFVKFAKYEPPSEDNHHALAVIRQAISTIEKTSV